VRLLHPGGGDVDTHTSPGSMVCTVMAAPASMELQTMRERITDSRIQRVLWLIEVGEPAS
jgi:DNA invertase Pin-like site-specific DNA recombinase